ncbi:MAG: polysaccharide deacetylase family protein [Pseudomonadota bacterium]|nr:polysaccharide deacetylase family protein [Pseudomonadota bacterium]
MIVMFHYIFDENDLSGDIYRPRYYCSLEKLNYITKKYLRQGKKFVTFREYSKIIRNEPGVKDKLVCFTFDDATIDHFNLAAPILQDLNVTASFYSITETLGFQSHETLPIHQYQIASSLVQNESIFCEHILELLEVEYGDEIVDFWRKKFTGWAGLDDDNILLVKRVLEIELTRSQSHEFIYSALNSIDNSLYKQFYNSSYKFYCGEYELKEINKLGFEVGSHSHSHRWLGHLPGEDAWDDIYKSITRLNNIGVIDKEWTICYPHGNWSSELLEILKCRHDCAGGVVIDDVSTNTDIGFLTKPRVDISIL